MLDYFDTEIEKILNCIGKSLSDCTQQERLSLRVAMMSTKKKSFESGKLAAMEQMEHAVNVSNQHLECYRKTYGSVPADTPAVAIDERTNSRGEPEAIYLQLHDPDSFLETEAGDFRADGVTWCWHKINHNDVRYIRQDLVSPSRSQQSAENINVGDIVEWDEYDSDLRKIVTMRSQVIRHNGDLWANGCGSISRIAKNSEIRVVERCPSHESEQGGAV